MNSRIYIRIKQIVISRGIKISQEGLATFFENIACYSSKRKTYYEKRSMPQTWDCISHLYFASSDMIGMSLDPHQVAEGICHKSVPYFQCVVQTRQTWFVLSSGSLMTKRWEKKMYQPFLNKFLDIVFGSYYLLRPDRGGLKPSYCSCL